MGRDLQSIGEAQPNEEPRPQQTPSPGGDEPSESSAQFESDRKLLQARAEKACAMVLASGKTNGRFSVSLSALRRAAAPELGDVMDAVACAIQNKWMRSASDRVELTAAGIYVAKSLLNLPR